MKKIGLLGGSFNPAHRGHRRISLAAMEALGLDEIWWLVSPGNPLKSAKGMAPYEARLESAREQAKGTRIKVSEFERQAGTQRCRGLTLSFRTTLRKARSIGRLRRGWSGFCSASLKGASPVLAHRCNESNVKNQALFSYAHVKSTARARPPRSLATRA